MSEAPANRRRFRLRLSLLNLLLLTAIVALSITVAMLWREVGPLRDEVSRHRDSLGIFEVGDAKRIHAIRLPTDDDSPRSYRVYLPPGRRYVLHYRANRIPDQGLPEVSTPYDLEAGGYLIHVKMERRHKPGTWDPIPAVTVRLDVEPTDGQRNSETSASIGISEATSDWIVNQETGSMSYGWSEIGRSLETLPPIDPLVLYRARAKKVVVSARHPDGEPASWSQHSIAGECDGFMVWIDAVEEDRRD